MLGPCICRCSKLTECVRGLLSMHRFNFSHGLDQCAYWAVAVCSRQLVILPLENYQVQTRSVTAE